MSKSIAVSVALLITAPFAAWGGAKPVGGISGALVVPKTTIAADEFFEVLLTLRNTGTKPVAVQTENPFAFDLDVKNEKGNLDSITEVWKLKPGKYRLEAKYNSDGFSGMTTTKPPAKAWKGKIQLLPIDVEVTAAAPQREVSMPDMREPEAADPGSVSTGEVAAWIRDLYSREADVRREAIRNLGDWMRHEVWQMRHAEEPGMRRWAAGQVDQAKLQQIMKALIDRLAANVESGMGYQEGSVCVTTPGGIREHVRVQCENETLAKALRQLEVTEAAGLLKRAHAEYLKRPAEERSSSVTHTFAYCIYMLSMEQVDVWEAGKTRPFEPGPIVEEEARLLLRPDLKPTGGLTALLWISSASRYPRFFVGDARLLVMLTVTNCTDEAAPLDLSPRSIAFSLVDSSGHRTNIPARQLARPVRDATLRSLGPRKSATCTWHIERLSDSRLGQTMKPGYVALKAIYRAYA